MKSFFDAAAREELQRRVAKLTPESRSGWGKMQPAQMLAHCTAALQVPVGDLKLGRSPMGLIGWMFRGYFTTEKPFSKNSPTAPEFKFTDPRDFEIERAKFQEAFDKLARGHSAIVCFLHPFFGKMSCEDWGLLVYKHLDHHFQQFGV